jgi:polysaccharide export outer membrane protein
MQTPVIQQANARTDAASQGMSVIASSWRGMERDNPGQGPVVEPHGDSTPVAAVNVLAPVDTRAETNTVASSVQQTSAGAVDAARSNETPWHAVVLTTNGSSTQSDKQPAPGVEPLPSAESLPAARLVPQPVQTGPPQPIVRANYHYPSHVHDAAATPPIPAVPREFEKQSLPPYVVEPPDILLINASNAITLPTQPLIGQHLVRPDGTINLGIYGSIYVAGLTLDQIQDVVASVLKARHARRKGEDGKPAEREMTIEEIKLELQVDVLAYNSKVYYIITDGGGYGEQVYRISATGNETVLDALSQINGLPAVASKKRIWVARATPDHSPPMILPVDWCGIVKNGSAATNYQIFPGDRVYVNSDALIRTDSALGKFLAPIERTLGTVLLGSSTVNSIRNGNNNTGNGVP